MPKIVKKKTVKEKIIHPNSRKALQISRQKHHDTKQQRRKDESSVKSQSKIEKFLWFQRRILDENYTELSPTGICELINEYMKRFDIELQQIQIIQNIRKRQPSQHVGRQDNIRFTIESEKEQFNTHGIELPDFLNKRNFEFFKLWDGNPNQLGSVKVKKFSQRALEVMVKKAASRAANDMVPEPYDLTALFSQNAQDGGT